ncbi:MAG: DNA-binding domain-containing protein [Gammaproteobacteria bacterium]|nr:DNA-binding domain-containing protein [Gammaproteobacteria bacterium]
MSTLQRYFQRHVLASSTEIVTHITDTQKTSSETRLAIYAEGYRTRLTAGLTGDFPALHTLLGEKGFEELAHAYIDVHPSEHFSMRYFGRHLSEFLARASPHVDMPVLSEMAAFEWRLRSAFDAADADVRSVNDIEAIEPSRWAHMRFGFHPSVNRLDLSWNVPAIWNAVEKTQELPAPEASDFPIPWLIWRQDLKTYFRSLTIDEAGSIDALMAGRSFARVCEQLCGWIEPESVAAHAARLLKRWVSDGLIASVSIRK